MNSPTIVGEQTTLFLLVGRDEISVIRGEDEPIGIFFSHEKAEEYRDAHFEWCIREGLYDEEDRDSDDFDIENLYEIIELTINPEKPE